MRKAPVRHVKSPYVFLDAADKPYLTRSDRMRISKATIAAMKAAAISGASFHTLRHTCASWAVQAGESLVKVQKLLGHSSFATTLRYAHLSPDHLKDTVGAIDAALAGRSRVTPRATQPDPAQSQAGAIAVSPAAAVI